MKILFLLISIFSITIELNAQDSIKKDTTISKPIAQSSTGTLSSVDVKAKPDFDYRNYLQSNLKYPNEALEKGVQGRIMVMFIVEINGMITNVKIVKGEENGHGLPEEALRVVKNMPKWQPAIQNGKPVRSYFTLPISFQLTD